MNQEKQLKKKCKDGRPPKIKPAIFVETINLTEEENECFLKMCEESGVYAKAVFIKVRSLGRNSFKVLASDPATRPYYKKLDYLCEKFRVQGKYYNLLIKELHKNSSEYKTRTLMRSLEICTYELVEINRKIIELTEQYQYTNR